MLGREQDAPVIDQVTHDSNVPNLAGVLNINVVGTADAVCPIDDTKLEDGARRDDGVYIVLSKATHRDVTALGRSVQLRFAQSC